jgi:hypothetical protein
MHLKKPKLNSAAYLLSLLLCLPSCNELPDFPACTAFPAGRWPELREKFYKLCGQDPSCIASLEEWKKEISYWSPPSDSGFCNQVKSQKKYDIDRNHPSPWKGKDGKPKQWKDIYSGGVLLPAKEAYAPLKTFIQVDCRDSGDCGEIGAWQSTLKNLDQRMQ